MGHARSLAMSPLLDQVVIRSNDRTILYSYRDIARYYVKNRKIPLPPHKLPRLPPSHI